MLVVFKCSEGRDDQRLIQNRIYKAGLMFNIPFLFAMGAAMVARRDQDVTMKANFSGRIGHGRAEAPRRKSADNLFPRRSAGLLLLACALLAGCQTGAESASSVNVSKAQNEAAAANGAPTYATDVAPILKQKCVSCHGRFLPQKGLRLHSREAIFEGGDNGPVLIPGNPQVSPLYTALNLPTIDPRHMPPVAGGQPLSAAEIATIRGWIAGGAL